jgi:hypothetical protein
VTRVLRLRLKVENRNPSHGLRAHLGAEPVKPQTKPLRWSRASPSGLFRSNSSQGPSTVTMTAFESWTRADRVGSHSSVGRYFEMVVAALAAGGEARRAARRRTQAAPSAASSAISRSASTLRASGTCSVAGSSGRWRQVLARRLKRAQAALHPGRAELLPALPGSALLWRRAVDLCDPTAFAGARHD